MAPPVKATPPLLLEFVAFANQTAAMSPPIEYHLLPKHMADNGWGWRARQTNAQLGAQSVLIDFEISVAKLDALDKTVVVDTISMGAPLSVFNASLTSRINLGASVMYLLFDRLPPQAPAAVQQPSPGPASGRPMTDAEVAAQRAAAAGKLNGAAPGPVIEEPIVERFEDLPDVVDGYLKSGLPLFKDVDAMGGNGAEIIEAMLFATEAGLESKTVTSPDQLTEFFTRNSQKVAFINDVGTPDQIARFKALLNNKAGELSAAAGTPPVRRRQPTA